MNRRCIELECEVFDCSQEILTGLVVRPELSAFRSLRIDSSIVGQRFHSGHSILGTYTSDCFEREDGNLDTVDPVCTQAMAGQTMYLMYR